MRLPCTQYLFAIEMFKSTVVRSVKPHQDGHHLAQSQAGSVMAFFRTRTRNQSGEGDRQEALAEIVNVAENRYHIQAELRLKLVCRPRVNYIYHIPQEFCYSLEELQL